MNDTNKNNGAEKEAKPLASVLSIVIKDKQALYMAYMPFLKNGGLFVPTDKPYGLGDELFLLVKVLNDSEKVKIAGKVVWVNPQGALSGRPQGIGVQFIGDDALKINSLFESKLGASVSLTRSNHTM